MVSRAMWWGLSICSVGGGVSGSMIDASMCDAFYIIFPHTIENAQTCCITLCSKSNSHIASEIVLSFARVRLKSAKSREHLKRRLHHQEKAKRTKPLSRFQMLIMTTSSSQTKTTILSKSLVIPLPSCDISTARI